ncbi:exodeoxyribonuclease III [Imperialibacter roseus]|uniref:Exodeoxyribonuclease III n=1 Tax=Imperialibacter roseus TaxID=1324217 RepID=A0ABZ0INW8_9BACT|nr:exodeoxyribonuclease III [Imperialibacter roseus]WOK06207.1 exodeoxyribonuclease III [Imperialibacter roseus]
MTGIISYNVNGIRSAVSKGITQWLKEKDPQIVCFQELKAHKEQIPVSLFEDLGYHCYWFPAVKKGYSGVAILSKTKPKHVEYGSGIDQSDYEGRVIRADFQHYSVMSVYVPSGSSGDERQDYKMQWLGEFTDYIKKVMADHPKLIISGDYNICHKPIDIHDPVSNKNSSGFLPEEREWLSEFIDTGFVDSFRQFNTAPHQYSWWTFRANARANNKGWRIDYHLATQEMAADLIHAEILPQVVHSDHCPVGLSIK